MPLLDIAELLTDPDLAAVAFSVTRRQQVMGSNGVASVVTTDIPNLFGAVYPTGDQSLTRDEAYETQASSIHVVTTFKLRLAAEKIDDSTSWLPDLVLWKGNHYLMKASDDFTQYGAGFVSADGILFEFMPEPTT